MNDAAQLFIRKEIDILHLSNEKRAPGCSFRMPGRLHLRHIYDTTSRMGWRCAGVGC